ncbi:MAG TPA: hypothetical protein VL093_12435 [Flavipsychrobacter sp.]|nr:hypothetical protein [Flavipsychrobacter sp.]
MIEGLHVAVKGLSVPTKSLHVAINGLSVIVKGLSAAVKGQYVTVKRLLVHLSLMSVYEEDSEGECIDGKRGVVLVHQRSLNKEIPP